MFLSWLGGTQGLEKRTSFNDYYDTNMYISIKIHFLEKKKDLFLLQPTKVKISTIYTTVKKRILSTLSPTTSI
jgi:hypothetical protein